MTQRSTVLESSRGSFKQALETARIAIRGLVTNLGPAIRLARREQGRSALQLVHACYWAGVMASLVGYRYEEYRRPVASGEPTASAEQERKT